ncbi:MAG: ADP-forming succinate--CoA ligase subunit beta [Firmicutes bacterium]|nr:ADP-forming succinate--CoA ligase subunit beta [Bacillota bacterium]
MKIHEYQAKELLKAFDIATQDGFCVESAAHAVDAAETLSKANGDKKFVIKAQIHSGGRGKGGGVKLATSLDEVKKIAEKMIGMNLVTHQTGAEGKKVTKILVTGAVDIKKEYYISITMDGALGCPIVVASKEGGTEIEVVAHSNPSAIITMPISPLTGLKDFHAINLAQKIELPKNLTKDFVKILKNMYKLFVQKDCSLLEINPLVIDGNGALLAIDAKINFDENALFRHPDIVALRDKAEEDQKEALAAESGLSYVSLDGSIGCMVNGAGLAMATMDIIKSYGGQPANFLDVGGTASAQKVAAAFKILLSDKNVKCILVNIFGGIMKCDIIAEGIIAAANEVNLTVPLVVRLDGTNVAAGREILAGSTLKIIPADSLSRAARLAVEQV